MIKVSIIIPVYNAENYLRECLDSVINQTLKEIEIICVNDGSTDSSQSILEEYEKLDKRIIILDQVNQYAGVARNKGLLCAKGEYIIFLDADDYFEVTMLESMYKKAQETSADVCICGAKYFNNETKHIINAPWILHMNMIGNKEIFSPDEIAKYIFNFVKPAPWNKMFNRKFIVYNDLKFQAIKRTNDLYFVFFALSIAKVIAICNEPFIYYRVGINTSLQATKQKDSLEFIDALLKLKKALQSKKNFELFEQSYINMALSNCLYNLKYDVTKFNYAINTLKLRGYGREYFYIEADYDNYLIKNNTYVNSDIILSVIIPMYKREKEIARCLDSVLEQTLNNIEIIVIDDGSPDDGYKIVEHYIKQFQNIFLFRQQNTGLGATRNAGIEKARGTYIMFLDADDIVPFDAYQKLYDYIKLKDADVVVGNVLRSVNNSKPFIPDWMNNLFKQYSECNCAKQFKIALTSPSAWNKMIKLSLIRKYKLLFTEARLVEDLEFSIKLFDVADRIYLLDEPVYIYFINEMPNSSLTQTTSADAVNAGLDVMSRVASFFNKRKLFEEQNVFITGPVSWLWDRFAQIDCEKDKYNVYNNFKKFLKMYFNHPMYSDSIIKVFGITVNEFIKTNYIINEEQIYNKTFEEIIIKKLQSNELGFRFIIHCFKIRFKFKFDMTIKTIKRKICKY